MGNGYVDPRSLDLGTGWRSVVSFRPRPNYHRGSAIGTYWIGDWVLPRNGLDLEKSTFLNLPGIELRHACHSARSQLLYRILGLCFRLPDSYKWNFDIYIICATFIGFLEWKCLFSETRYRGKCRTLVNNFYCQFLKSGISQFWWQKYNNVRLKKNYWLYVSTTSLQDIYQCSESWVTWHDVFKSSLGLTEVLFVTVSWRDFGKPRNVLSE